MRIATLLFSFGFTLGIITLVQLPPIYPPPGQVQVCDDGLRILGNCHFERQKP